MHDRTEQLVFECDFSVSVLGRGAVYILIDNQAPNDPDLVAYATAKGLTWRGVLGMKNGVPRVECGPDPESAVTMAHAGLAFCVAHAEHLRRASEGDSVDWLRALYALPDPRGCARA